MADLRVELYGELVVHLVGVDRRTFDFFAERNASESFRLGSTILRVGSFRPRRQPRQGATSAHATSAHGALGGAFPVREPEALQLQVQA